VSEKGSIASTESSAQRASSTKRIRVLWNANAGSKGGISTNSTGEPELRELMARRGLGDDLVASTSEEEAVEATRDARESGYHAVVAAGGDGTVRLAATHLLESDTSLGILPMGSVMNIARMLGISRDLEEAAATVAAGATRRIDVGMSGDEPFFESASVGMNAAIFKQVQQADEGDYRGIARALRTAFRYRPARVVVELDEGTLRTRALMITVSNGPYTGAGFTVAPDARVDDGRFDVNVYRHFSKLDLIRHFGSIAFGRRAYSPHVRTYRSRRVRIEGSQPLPARADSEDLGTTPVEFLTRHQVLSVIVPREPLPGSA
jgi:diacylglycerol kinase (ATP)